MEPRRPHHGDRGRGRALPRQARDGELVEPAGGPEFQPTRASRMLSAETDFASRPPRSAAQVRGGRKGPEQKDHNLNPVCGPAVLAKPSTVVPQTVRPALLRRIYVSPRRQDDWVSNRACFESRRASRGAYGASAPAATVRAITEREARRWSRACRVALKRSGRATRPGRPLGRSRSNGAARRSAQWREQD